jgi:hypothetical protein
MERQELLDQFNSLLETYGKHKAYADKAREQAQSFSSGIIEKVIADHQIKASLVADDIQPLVPQIGAEIAQLTSAKNEVEQSKGDLGSRIEELELRKMIGEISDEEFDSMTADGRDTVDAADSEIETIDAALSELQAALDSWSALSGASVDAEPLAAAASVDEEPLAVASAEVEEDIADVDAPEDVIMVEEDDSDPVVDAILPGFEDQVSVDDSVEIEEESVAFDIDDGEMEASVDVVPEGDDAAASVEVEVEDSAVDEIGVDPSEDASVADEADDEGPRRAILLSNEGTPEEQIYALTGEVFTVGRGRDNDLQIKNDSKVSRFHCKLYRRGANYYLEDNKSSNGTMVNGELISERRLFGGEELVIGETFFRFRVM